MESTGVYWIAPHEVLEGQRLQVLLVDTRLDSLSGYPLNCPQHSPSTPDLGRLRFRLRVGNVEP